MIYNQQHYLRLKQFYFKGTVQELSEYFRLIKDPEEISRARPWPSMLLNIYQRLQDLTGKFMKHPANPHAPKLHPTTINRFPGSVKQNHPIMYILRDSSYYLQPSNPGERERMFYVGNKARTYF